MRLSWRPAVEAARKGRTSAETDVAGAAQACPGISQLLERVLSSDRPQILDLGSCCGSNAVYLADRGARVSVDEFRPPAASADDESGEATAEEPAETLRIRQPEGIFQLVLAWELIDFIPPPRLAEFAAELHRVLARGGWLLLLSLNDPAACSAETAGPARFRILEEGKLVREPSGAAPQRRWVHATRRIERALEPLAIQGVQLHRNQMREFVARKKPAAARIETA